MSSMKCGKSAATTPDRQPHTETQLGNSDGGEPEGFQRLRVEPISDTRFRNGTRRLRHNVRINQDHSISKGRSTDASRCANPANSSSVSPVRHPTAVNSVPGAARPFRMHDVLQDGVHLGFDAAAAQGAMHPPGVLFQLRSIGGRTSQFDLRQELAPRVRETRYSIAKKKRPAAFLGTAAGKWRIWLRVT